MIYGFARQCGGHAQIHSRPGRGSTICVLLPRHRTAPPPQPAAAVAHRAAVMSAVIVGAHAVLVVEDEPIVRMLIVDMLEQRDHRVFEAEDGASDLALLDAQPKIDLLVSDLELPGDIGGRQLADAARHRRHGLRVLFVSGYAGIGSPDDSSLLEADTQIIGKPFSIDEFNRRVGLLLASS